MKLALFIAFLGHVICGITDCMMAYTPNGRFEFADAKDPERMSRLFAGMPPRRLEWAVVLGAIALLMASVGFVSLGMWARSYSEAISILMTVCGLGFVVPITAHHVCCGAVEWFYVRAGRTEQELDAVLEFFKRTSATAAIGYGSLLVFAAAFFVLVLSGRTDLPRWACVFNTLPFYIPLAPTRLPAKGNIANALMFLGLLFWL